MSNDKSATTKAEFYDWLRGHQENKRLDQTQVNAMEPLLDKVSIAELQAALGKLNGWYVPGAGMQLSAAAVEMLKDYEEYVGHPYKDMVGKWTIGYGNTYYPDGTKVRSTDKHITEPEAAKLKQTIIDQDFGPGVNRIFADEIAAGKLNQNQFDALVSLAYNVGIATLAKSNSITKNIKAGHYQSAANGFLKYNNGTVNGKFGPINGLTIRRGKERALFLKQV
jgi:lysozyme